MLIKDENYFKHYYGKQNKTILLFTDTSIDGNSDGMNAIQHGSGKWELQTARTHFGWYKGKIPSPCLLDMSEKLCFLAVKEKWKDKLDKAAFKNYALAAIDRIHNKYPNNEIVINAQDLTKDLSIIINAFKDKKDIDIRFCCGYEEMEYEFLRS